MICKMFGGDNTAPSTTVAQFNFINPCFQSSWSSTESQRRNPLSDDMILTGWSIQLDAAPGAGKSYTFAIRDDGVDVATITISDTATTGSWSGNVSIAAGSLVCVSATPSGTPTASTNQYWQINYSTNGNYFLMMGASSVQQDTVNTKYQNPNGGQGILGSSTYTDFDFPCPTNMTVNKITASADAAPGAAASGKKWDVAIAQNNTNFLTATIFETETQHTTSGSLSFTPGDSMVMRYLPTAGPAAARIGWCMSITPDVSGECVFGFGNFAAIVSDATTRYEQMLSMGNNGWNSSENVRYLHPPAGDYKKMYVRVGTAPGGTTSRVVTLMDNGSPTSLAATITGASTTGSDTTNTATVSGGGNTGTLRMTEPSGAPAALSGVHVGYVLFVPQPTNPPQIEMPNIFPVTRLMTI